MAVVDVAAGSGDQDAALVLGSFAVAVKIAAEKLLVGETSAEEEEQAGGDEIKKDDAGIVALVGLEEFAGAVGEIVIVGGHGRLGVVVGVVRDERERTGLDRKKPRGDER